MDKRWFVAGSLVVAVIFGVFLMSLDGSEDGGGEDPSGDVVVTEPAPDDPELADIASVSVTRDDDRLVFEAEMVEEIPTELPGSLDFRWDIRENGKGTWLVSAVVNVAPAAALVSQSGDEAFSTIDGTLPGEVSIEGRKLQVILDAAEVEGFPTDFSWRLGTRLVSDRSDSAAGTAEDNAPDS